MSHPVINKRNEEIKKEFKELYAHKFWTGELYVEEIISKLAKKYNVSSETIKKVVYPK